MGNNRVKSEKTTCRVKFFCVGRDCFYYRSAGDGEGCVHLDVDNCTYASCIFEALSNTDIKAVMNLRDAYHFWDALSLDDEF
jgi:hypothetical protein